MIVKQVLFGSEARDKLMSGIETLARAVKSTLGAKGRTVMIESENHIKGITSTKDGVTVAKSINLEDPVENLAIQTVREAAENTAKQAGDGTTTSIVLAEAIINAAHAKLEDKMYNRTQVVRGMIDFVNEVCGDLDKMSTPISDDNLYKIATISANNDAELGKMIGDAYMYVGSNGVVTVKDGTDKTVVHTSNGIKFDRGYMSEYQLTDRRKRHIEYNGDVKILISDRKLESISQIEAVLAQVIQNKETIIFLCELDYNAQIAINTNVLKNGFKAAQVLPPNFGRRRVEMLQDIANVTGGTLISDSTGDDWSLIRYEDLGTVKGVFINEHSTSFFDEEVFGSDEFKLYINDLIEDMDSADTDEDKDDIRNRIAMLSGKTATIEVGGTTDMEQKERKDRVDDAVLATRAAMLEGVLPGGGSSLLHLSWKDYNDNSDPDKTAAISIIQTAMKSPFQQILTNADIDPDSVADEIFNLHMLNTNKGYNVMTDEIEDLMESGIIDPTKVTKTALRNATSVAATILQCDTVISNVRDYGK